MGKNKITIIEIPCLRNGCEFMGSFHFDETQGEPERKYKLQAIRSVINQLKSEHEAGKHVRCHCTHSCACHCRPLCGSTNHE